MDHWFMNSEQPESESKKQLMYYAPSRQRIEGFVRAVCIDLEANGEKLEDREALRSDLAYLLEVIADIYVAQKNK